MGESIVESPKNAENKTRESPAAGGTLEVSVSFGRFESDSLSWEKWSSFSPNKYLEEVEKCSTPGSVAQKKAYFEAHYKRIAARKAAEQLKEQQEDQMDAHHSTEDNQNGEDRVVNTSLTSSELSVANNRQSSTGVEQANDSIGVVSSSYSDESNESAAIDSSSVDMAKEEIDSAPDGSELNKPEVVLAQQETRLNGVQVQDESLPVLVQEDTHLNGSLDKLDVESPIINLEKVTGNNLGNKKENVKLGASNKSQKVITSKKEKSLAGAKIKQASPLPKKSPEISIPKASKPTPSPTGMTASRVSTKKANGSSLPRSKNLYAGEIKKVAPSLHMSRSLGHSKSDSTSFTPPRKSLIMERMGDKDIVKRAFKTFQNSFNQVRDSGDEKCSGQKEVSTTRPEHKMPTSLTPRKENEGIMKPAEKMDAQRAQFGRSWNATSAGIRRPAEKMDAQRAQLGRSWNSTSAGSSKGAGMDHKSAKPAPSLSLRSGERAEKRKEFLKKLEEKSHAREAEKTRISSMSKEEKDAEMKELRQSLNFKATPLPGFYRGHALSKFPSDKEGTRNKHHHQLDMHR